MIANDGLSVALMYFLFIEYILDVEPLFGIDRVLVFLDRVLGIVLRTSL